MISFFQNAGKVMYRLAQNWNLIKDNHSQASWYSIYLPRRDGRLSWRRWLVTYRDGIPAHRQWPIQVLTGSDVE